MRWSERYLAHLLHFVPERTGLIFVVGRVREVLEKAQLTNIRFERITEIERS